MSSCMNLVRGCCIHLLTDWGHQRHLQKAVTAIEKLTRVEMLHLSRLGRLRVLIMFRLLIGWRTLETTELLHSRIASEILHSFLHCLQADDQIRRVAIIASQLGQFRSRFRRNIMSDILFPKHIFFWRLWIFMGFHGFSQIFTIFI